jgi:NitT/TauT family transport system substrate-binding protein
MQDNRAASEFATASNAKRVDRRAFGVLGMGAMAACWGVGASATSTLAGTASSIAGPAASPAARSGAVASAPVDAVVATLRIACAWQFRGPMFHLPLAMAQSLGFFEREGLKLEWAEQATDARSLQALGQSSADVVAVGADAFLMSQSRGSPQAAAMPTVCLGAHSRAPMVGMALPTKLADVWLGGRDWEGKRVGLPAPNSMAQALALAVLERERVDPQRVEWVSVGSAGAAANALRQGRVDVLFHTEPALSQLVMAGDAKLRWDARAPAGCAQAFGFGGAAPLGMPGGCLVASNELARTQPRAVQALCNGVAAALAWLAQASGRDLLRAVPDVLRQGDAALLLEMWNAARAAFVGTQLVQAHELTLLMRCLQRLNEPPQWADSARLLNMEFAQKVPRPPVPR